MTGGCWQCGQPLPDDPVTLDYSKDSTLHFCHERCRRDFLDELPDGSLILDRHEDTPDVTPWAKRRQ